MKKRASRRNRRDERDTMRPEYDFSAAVRGVTAARYAQGTNVVVIDPEVLDVFPDGTTVNQTLRALAPVLRQQRRVVKTETGPYEALRPATRKARRG